jgi:hypothetical protein
MNPIIYNVSMLLGLLLVSVGVGLWSLPGGLVTAGVLVIGITIYGVERILGVGRRQGG